MNLKNLGKNLRPVLLVGSVPVVILGVILWAGIVDEQDTRAKRKWLHEHECVVVGYVGAEHPQPVYRCDDGLHIWRDLPEAGK